MEGAKRLDEQKFEPEMVKIDQKEEWEAKSMAQKLEEVMQEMSTEINGFVLGAVAGMDGMNITQLSKGKLDADAITGSLTIFLKLSSAANEKSGMGVMEDLLIQTDTNYIIQVFLPGDPQHFLVAIVDRKNGSLGNMRLISKIYADRFSKIIPR
jgi:predicted regulator of Ras-like GTPase activity (Roadblock/LC7/MglB family)